MSLDGKFYSELNQPSPDDDESYLEFIKDREKRIYACWRSMRQRCDSKNYKQYRYYGGRGIIICDEWKNNLQNFYIWAIENGWRKNLRIDRIDNDDNYCPENCRFITNGHSLRNKRLLPIHNKSGYRGVFWHKGKWRSQIWYNNTAHYLGRFKSKKLAAIRFDVEAFLLNDGRPMNFIGR